MDEITSNDNNRIREFGRNGYLTLESAPGERQDRNRGLLHGQPDRRLDAEPPHRGLGRQRAAQLSPAEGLQLHEEPDRERQHRRAGGRRHLSVQPARPGALRPEAGSSQLPGLRPSRRRRLRVQRRRADLARVHVGSAQGRAAITWYKQPADVIAQRRRRRRRQLLPPRHPARRHPPTARTTARSPLPTQTCTYAGPNQAPPPPTNPSPSPSPSTGPTPHRSRRSPPH